MSGTKGMTSKKHSRKMEVLGAIRAYRSQFGYAPTREYLMSVLKFRSTQVVDYYIARLRSDGLLKDDDQLSKSVEIARSGGKSQQRNLILFPDNQSDLSKKLNARIDAVVAKAQARESAGYDVIRDSHFISLRARGCRIG